MRKELRFKSKQLKNIMQILAASKVESRLIGGCVRDALLDKYSDDIDIATTLVPDEVISVLTKRNITVIPTGIKYGTVTALFKGEKFEITTLRKDVSCDGRRANVEYTCDFAQDALRRDFTINALSYCIFEQRLFDYFGGLEHLQQRRVIFICDPAERIREDHLRILRFFRFSAYYADDFDEIGLLACNANAYLLSSLAQERINMEFDKILLKSNNLIKVLRVMNSCVLKIIFPSLRLAISKLEIALQCSNNIGIPLGLETIYAILLSSNKSVDLSKFKFSNLRKKQILQMLGFLLSGAACTIDIKLRLKKLWATKQNVSQFLLLALVFEYIDQFDAQKLFEFFNSTAAPIFPINGNELRNLGYTGKDIGNMLNYLYDIWVAKNFNITSQELIQCLEPRR
jgi:poly(A) polymerase